MNKLENVKNIHMIGIGGISMSAIALMLKEEGYNVTGSDSSRGAMVIKLEEAGIKIHIGSDASVIEKADLVIYTAAIKQHDPEFVKAKELKIPMYERAEFLGILMEKYNKNICIAGTHGKTTTTSMVASIFLDAGKNPTVQVGAQLAKLNNLNYHIGSNEYFILEACEYVDSFLNFPHETAIILNIDADHLDYFSSIADIRASFKKFILMLPQKGNLIINSDDENCNIILEELAEELKAKEINVYTFSLNNPNASIYAKDVTLNENGSYSYIAVNTLDGSETPICLGALGTHNVYNSLSAIMVAYIHGANITAVKNSLKEFTGAARRFDYKKTIKNNIEIYDDYAHHPTEIKATLESAKNRVHGKGKVIAIFQPHTYSRTRELLNEFATCFTDADKVIITDIYAAREADDGTVSSVILVKKIQENGKDAQYISNFADIAKYVTEIAESGDIILTIGAGTITNLSEYFN